MLRRGRTPEIIAHHLDCQLLVQDAVPFPFVIVPEPRAIVVRSGTTAQETACAWAALIAVVASRLNIELTDNERVSLVTLLTERLPKKVISGYFDKTGT